MILFRIVGIRKLVLIIQNVWFWLFYGNKFGNRVKIFGWPIVSMSKDSEIQMGHHVTLISNPYFSEPGINHPVILRTLSPQSRIQVGDHVGLSGGGICAATEVIIGNNVMLGANAFITDTDFHPLNPTGRRFQREGTQSQRVIIEDNVFIGMNSLVLKGVTIGENSIIGAGSVVTKDIPANCIAAGTPARVLRPLIQTETE